MKSKNVKKLIASWNRRRTLTGRNNYDLFGTDRFENLHYGKLFAHLNNCCFFNRYRIQHSINAEELCKVLVEKYSLTTKQILKIDSADSNKFGKIDFDDSERLLVPKDNIMIAVTSEIVDILYTSEISNQEILEICELCEKFKKTRIELKHFCMIQKESGSFRMAEFTIKPSDFDINLHYNDDFIPVHNQIVQSLHEKKRNGLILLHGKYGSGKTYYLRHLISSINRRFIYLPLYLVEAINSPEFLPFIADYPDSILILEDCEAILAPRENGNPNGSAISNLLNLGDGLLADALSVNVICTFNAGLKKVDDAILRKGRLIARYEFKELETKKAQNLAETIGKSCNIEKPMTVSDIYNISEPNFENKPIKTIGFKVA